MSCPYASRLTKMNRRIAPDRGKKKATPVGAVRELSFSALRFSTNASGHNCSHQRVEDAFVAGNEETLERAFRLKVRHGR